MKIKAMIEAMKAASAATLRRLNFVCNKLCKRFATKTTPRIARIATIKYSNG
jgi:hypothetical protein